MTQQNVSGEIMMFDVKKHLIKVQGGRQYLPVAARLIWFRSEHPDWGIETKAIAIDMEKQYAIFESTVFNAEGRLMAKGAKMENIRGFGDWLEKAETGAIGRALAVCGYGTQFAPDLDESQGNSIDSVDTPYPMNGNYREERGRFEHQTQPYRGRPDSGVSVSSTTSESTGEPKGLTHGDGLSLIKHQPDDEGKSTGEYIGEKPDSCVTCSATLKPSQLSLSVRKFGAALCPDCQRKRKPGQAA
jgi:hypothetical protein